MKQGMIVIPETWEMNEASPATALISRFESFPGCSARRRNPGRDGQTPYTEETELRAQGGQGH